MSKRLLAAVDGSPRALGVVASALELARYFDAKVHLYRAVAVPPEFPPSARGPADALSEHLAAEAMHELEKLAGADPRIVVEPPDLNSIQPWRSIIAAGVRLEVSLIVVGSHGYRGWDRVLGTTAARVVDHADRNVLIIHERR